MARKLGIALGIAAAMVLGLIVLLAVSAPSGAVSTDAEGNHFIEIAMLTVRVADQDPLIEIPDQFLGVVHPPPEFDTTDIGPDLNFSRDTAELRPLDSDEVLRAVYLGHDVDGEPYYIWHSGSPNFRQMLGQILADFGAFGRLETSYGTETGGGGLLGGSLEDSIAEEGLTAGSLSQATGSPSVLTVEWHALPEDVAVVVVYQDGDPLGWQRPVSGTVAFRQTYDGGVETFGHSIEMVALTTGGDEWKRRVIWE